MTRAELEAALAANRAELAVLQARLAAIEGSTAWRITAGIVALVDRHPMLLLLFWAMTFRAGRVRHYIEGRRLIRLLLRNRSQWDPVFYRAQRPDLAPPTLDLLRHYALRGRSEGLAPNADFDPAWYAAQNGTTLGHAPIHWLEHGLPRGLPANAILSLRAKQAEALGHAMPTGHLAIGIVTFETAAAVLQRLHRSVEVAARRAEIEPSIWMLDNGGPASGAVSAARGVKVLPSGGNVGFGAAHNRLMQHAYAHGATHYLALNPDAALHPDALRALLCMSHASGGRALVEAIQFPAEHQVPYDAETFDTPWASGACLLIPRAIYDAIGGFDDGFFMYCEDVDFSWRARAAGFRAQTCPAALLFHPTTNRVLDVRTEQMFLESGLRLAVKWGDRDFAERTRNQLVRLGLVPPDLSTVQPAADAGGIVDFEHDYTFAPGRW